MRGSDISHARMYWADGRVRFDYLDQGIPMVQIFDTRAHKVIWLDTENKVYLEKELPVDSPLSIAQEGRSGQVDNTDGEVNPCDTLEQAECTRLKETVINGRNTVKWLITTTHDGYDIHAFQWLDTVHGIPVRQENPDGSVLNVRITEDQEYDGRKVRKVDMVAISADGKSAHGVQWYDEELDVVVRQQSEGGAVDELRNITVEAVNDTMFTIPEGYMSVKDRMSDSASGRALTFESVSK